MFIWNNILDLGFKIFTPIVVLLFDRGKLFLFLLFLGFYTLGNLTIRCCAITNVSSDFCLWISPFTPYFLFYGCFLSITFIQNLGDYGLNLTFMVKFRFVPLTAHYSYRWLDLE